MSIKSIYVFGEISESTSSCIIPDLAETDFKTDKIKQLHIYICSEGGYLSHSFAIIDFITKLKKKYKFTIHTHAMGEIASGAFFLFLLGDKKILYPSCRIYVHEHSTINEEPKTYSIRIKEDKTSEKLLYEMYLKYTSTQLNLSRRKAKLLLKRNAWLSSGDIKRFNILGENDE